MTQLFIVVVAAGVGSRYGGEIPKQYTCIHQHTVLQHTIGRLAALATMKTAVGLQVIIPIRVVISPNDNWASQSNYGCKIDWIAGGEMRRDSVYQGVHALHAIATPNDLVLIHDAARPYVPLEDLYQVVEAAACHQVGAFLATPVRDTLKRYHQDDLQTVSRQDMYLAQTPQVFRYQVILETLQQASNDDTEFTDEAHLLEAYQHPPILVTGRSSNIKLTYPEDKLLLSALLAQ